MQEMIRQLPNGDAAWRTFLAFDRAITETIERECRQAGIARVARTADMPVATYAAQVAAAAGIVLPTA